MGVIAEELRRMLLWIADSIRKVRWVLLSILDSAHATPPQAVRHSGVASPGSRSILHTDVHPPRGVYGRRSPYFYMQKVLRKSMLFPSPEESTGRTHPAGLFMYTTYRLRRYHHINTKTLICFRLEVLVDRKPTCSCGSADFEDGDVNVELPRRVTMPAATASFGFAPNAPIIFFCNAKVCKACGQITLWTKKAS
jgi:hypothetical protein